MTNFADIWAIDSDRLPGVTDPEMADVHWQRFRESVGRLEDEATLALVQSLDDNRDDTPLLATIFGNSPF